MRIAVLASHGGTILQAVIDACTAAELDAQVVLVISNNSRSGAMARAQAAGLDTLHLSSTTHPEADALDGAMLSALNDAGADWVLLAGYMKRLGPRVLASYRNRILNTHPALLPKFGGEGFYGRRVHEAVLAAGETETGATVHLVDEAYDSGPILAQVRVPVRRQDDPEALEQRVKVAERKLVVATLAELAEPRAAAG
ncbi:MAG: phosphoribosylglycinamide formyltransferase [Gammaproteobacteria bacterium]|nr:phosphoribosylglycinamide formyltransferase [Gammaproteobacteria bacterium]